MQVHAGVFFKEQTFESLSNTHKICREHFRPGVWQLHHFSELLWRNRTCKGLLKSLETRGAFRKGQMEATVANGTADAADIIGEKKS